MFLQCSYFWVGDPGLRNYLLINLSGGFDG